MFLHIGYSNNKKYNKCNSIQQTIYSASKNTITIMMKVSQFISTAKSDIYINTFVKIHKAVHMRATHMFHGLILFKTLIQLLYY